MDVCGEAVCEQMVRQATGLARVKMVRRYIMDTVGQRRGRERKGRKKIWSRETISKRGDGRVRNVREIVGNRDRNERVRAGNIEIWDEKVRK